MTLKVEPEWFASICAPDEYLFSKPSLLQSSIHVVVEPLLRILSTSEGISDARMQSSGLEFAHHDDGDAEYANIGRPKLLDNEALFSIELNPDTFLALIR
ncbi:hypothetical protein ROBYS_38950 [Roseobacter sp. OBYS 0001]|nr:hypothetical protein ROBYS_38950 [Roseobacter sp. OBYS 0001]